MTYLEITLFVLSAAFKYCNDISAICLVLIIPTYTVMKYGNVTQ